MADSPTLQEKYDAAMASLGTLQTKLDAALQKHQDDAIAHESDKAVALAAQAEELGKQHAAFVADLKAKTIIPALKDYHARQAADLAAQQAAQLELAK